ncbi:amidase [Mycolicibacterium goodii]|uniref:amidase n=1 Tax=Mycolicibacterium goodii TaxID=134601 RepID=UPI001BDCDE2E|nr:amidase [Mycolicibacterium goodii]MBU8828918.1 amidase [Mycolicibacterium goodii]
MTQLPDMTAAQLLAGYRSKDISPVQVVDAIFERIDKWDEQLNALYRANREGSRAAAAASEERWRRGEPAGLLDGVPVTVKENIATKGCPVPLGSASSDQAPSGVDSPTAARLREAHAVVIGKTTMPDFGMAASGVSSLHGVTRNPWNLNMNPGGSSSGAGAAAAAGYGPLHVGTDIAGSVRLPANWCGVVGFKPSFGRIPVDPPYTGRTIGPLTRTVEDSALLMAAIARPDYRDHTILPSVQVDWETAAAPLDLSGVRIGFMPTAGAGLPVEHDVADAVAQAVARLESHGAAVEIVKPILTEEMLDGLTAFLRIRLWAQIQSIPSPRRERIHEFFLRWTDGADALTGPDVFAAQAQIDAIASSAHRTSAEIDYLVSPVAPVAAFPAERMTPTNDTKSPFDNLTFTLPFNLSQQPAISINCGWTTAGTPIGLQIAGKRFDDIGVLRAAAAYESFGQASRPWPVK